MDTPADRYTPLPGPATIPELAQAWERTYWDIQHIIKSRKFPDCGQRGRARLYMPEVQAQVAEVLRYFDRYPKQQDMSQWREYQEERLQALHDLHTALNKIAEWREYAQTLETLLGQRQAPLTPDVLQAMTDALKEQPATCAAQLKEHLVRLGPYLDAAITLLDHGKLAAPDRLMVFQSLSTLMQIGGQAGERLAQYAALAEAHLARQAVPAGTAEEE